MLNVVILQGRLTADPELRMTQTGKSVVSFNLACDRAKKEDGCDFIRCTGWEKTADFVSKYFHKGDMILLDGQLRQREWQDKNGNKRTEIEVLVRNVNFCGSKSQPQQPMQRGGTIDVEPTYAAPTVPDSFEIIDDGNGDLPF